jgi:hypothetical protein
MRVDFDGYMHELGKELQKGVRRATRDGGAPPLSRRSAKPTSREEAKT